LFYLPPQFEYDFGNLEPRYNEYNARNAYIRRVYSGGGRRNPAYVIVDSYDDALAVNQKVRALIMADTATTVSAVESLQERFPTTTEEQAEKLERIARIRQLLDDPMVASEESEELDHIRRAASTRNPISETEVPDYLKDRFMSKSGEIGKFVLIYPRYGLSDGRNSMAFAAEVGTIELDDGRMFHAGSTSLVAADMLRLMRKEAPWMVLLTFAVVAVLMLVNFGSVRWAALATIPLVVGVMWMLLVMGIFDMKLNFYNLIVLPAVLGIGNDAGVHLVHRYREEGAGSIMDVLRSTGEHVTIGAVTTIIGFSGPLLSFHPGLNTIGRLAVVGISTTLAAAILFLPAMLQWLESGQKVSTADAASTDELELDA
jgi:predicted RND superfamily exporter protein